jgi:hypothetical protein
MHEAARCERTEVARGTHEKGRGVQATAWHSEYEISVRLSGAASLRDALAEVVHRGGRRCGILCLIAVRMEIYDGGTGRTCW